MVGKTISHYRILEKLGSGGMGVVYKAEDNNLGRIVALKFLPEEFANDARALERLRREARAGSSLNHPNICTIHEVSEADGHTYIAMEYVEGRPLNALITAEGLPAEAVIRYGTQIADALAHAHDCGFIHRDLKSSNVIITREGRPKVLDFGLAQRLREEDLTSATLSEASLRRGTCLAGTVHYMAPELLRGELADRCSDVWALGVLLYEMAAGTLPFQGQTGFELTSAILRESPTPLPARVAAGLRTIIQRCLAKERVQRYQRAGEVRAALEAIESHSSVVSAASPALAVPVSTRLSTGGRPSTNVEANEYFEKAILGKTQYRLPWMRQMLERALELDPHFAEARAEYGFMHVLMIDAGYSNDPCWLYKAEEEIRRALQEDPNSGRAHSSLAAVYLYQGRKELVPREVENALRVNPDDLEAGAWMQNYHQLNGDYDAAEELAKRLVERAPVYFPGRMNLGWIRLQQGDTAGAIRQQEKVLEQDPVNIYAICFLARSYMEADDLGMVRCTLERARPEDRQSYLIRVCRALLSALEGKQEEARQEMDDQVLQYLESALPWTPMAAEFYAVLGESEKAVHWLHKAVRNGDERGEWFRRDPLLANVHEHPRFRQILESIAFRRQQRGRSVPAP